MRLKAWAAKHGIHYRTAWNMFKAGNLPGAYQLPTGTICVQDEQAVQVQEHVVVYARVSSSENKTNLESQAERVSAFCAAKGWVVKEVVKECASGLNDKRPKLERVFKERKATKIVVEHKDRLTRFGYNFIEVLWPTCQVVVINEVVDDKADLMQDFVSLVTSFCARLYGHRRSTRKTEQVINALKQDN